MRRTDQSNGHTPISRAAVVPERSTPSLKAQAVALDSPELPRPLGVQAGYDFGRIPIFSIGQGSHRSPSKVSRSTERVEREADQMAKDVLHRPAGLSRQRERQGVPVIDRTSNLQPAGTSGQPLAPATRMFFETRFGVDLGRVRIFSDSSSAPEVESINAKAFTTGERIVFGPGAYAPETASGRSLLAHELAHVVQQRTSQAPSDRLYRSPQDNPESIRAEVQRLAEEMNQLAAKNAWAGVDRSYRRIETLGDGAFAMAQDPAALHFLGAQAARNLGDIRRYKSLALRAKTALLVSGRTIDDPQLQAVEAEVAAIDQAYGAVTIAPRSKRSANAKKGETVGPELVPAVMPFAGDQRTSIERARTQIVETGSFSGLLPAGAYTLGTESFTVIAGTNVPEVLWGS